MYRSVSLTCISAARSTTVLKIGKDKDALQKMQSAAVNVKKTLKSLKSVLKEEKVNSINEILHDLIKTSNGLTTSQNYEDTMNKVKDLTKITSKLIKALEKEIAEEQDSEYQVSFDFYHKSSFIYHKGFTFT